MSSSDPFTFVTFAAPATRMAASAKKEGFEKWMLDEDPRLVNRDMGEAGPVKLVDYVEDLCAMGSIQSSHS